MKFSKDIKLFTSNMLMLIICIVGTLYIYINTNHEGYSILFTQPMVYYLVFFFILNRRILNVNNNLFIIVFTGVSFIRFVLLPIFVIYSGFYGGRSAISPSNDSFFLAIILMNFELITVSILIHIFGKRTKITNKEINFNQKFRFNLNHGYYLFFLFTLLLIVLFPRIMSQVNFIVPLSLNFNSELNTIENIVLYCVIVSKQLAYIILINKIQHRYEKRKNEFWVAISVIISLINISIYFGVNRMDIVINALVSIYILMKLYGNKINKYFIILIPIILMLYSVITESRNYVSISGDNSWVIDVTDIFQAYTGGVYNVAIAIETVKFYPQVRNLKVFFMDIFRPMIGPNILVRHINVPYSNIFFNKRIRPNSDIVSQIIPMVGQGFIFFGPLFSSILSLIFVRIQYYLEKLLNNTSSLEMFYFVSLSTARLGMVMGNNTMNLINDLSMNLVLFTLVFLFNKYIVISSKKSRKINEKNIQKFL